MKQIVARCQGEEQTSRRRLDIFDVSDQIVAESALMPSIYIQDKIREMRSATALSYTERFEKLQTASQLYREANLADLDIKSYSELVSKVTGLPQYVITNSINQIAHNLYHMKEIIQAAVPAGAILNYSNCAAHKGCSFFSRRGDTLAVIAAGNGPGIHGLWPQAIALGYRTLVKPSSREPFTAQRLVCALEEAGLAQYIALIPTDHKGVDTLISQSDLSIIYGGPEVVSRYVNNPHVLTQGPGRSKIIIGKDIPHEEAIPTAVQSMLSLGGAACVSASAILVESDHHGFAQKLRAALTLHTKNKTQTKSRCLDAKAYQQSLSLDAPPWQPDGTSSPYTLKPHIAVVESAADKKVQRELPFPCITVAPFTAKEGYRALSNSLVVTVLSRQQNLIHNILADASISNVYIGKISTTWMDSRVPHDGYLTDFLMCNRGLNIEPGWLTSI